MQSSNSKVHLRDFSFSSFEKPSEQTKALATFPLSLSLALSRTLPRSLARSLSLALSRVSDLTSSGGTNPIMFR